MHWIVKGGVAVVGLAGLAAAGGYGWARSAMATRLDQHFEAHDVDIAVPMPLTPAEVAALRAERLAALVEAGQPTVLEDGTEVDPLAGVDLGAIAQERAMARGKHLLASRYACTTCHGEDFGGGVMIDDPAIGHLLGPNLTMGKGSRTIDYTIADWDRMIRHGIKPDGRPTVMPAQDFLEMSDQELSDIVTYVRSLPPVDATIDPVVFGPLGTVLVATDQIFMAAEMVTDHHKAHLALPPAPEDQLAFGAHLAAVCIGCHRTDLAGGTIPGGDPSWPPALNITPHEDGLAGWTYEQFLGALQGGKRVDGTPLRAPMSDILRYAEAMRPEELEALWAYLQSVPPHPNR